MGVKQLWTLLAPVGRPVLLETMEGKTVAIDSSIWIYQFQATMRDRDGRALVNAHLVGFLRRICKLLYYGMKPIFVFDGGAPVIKKATLNERRKKKSGAAASHARVAERILAAQLRREAVNHVAKVSAQKAGKGNQRPIDNTITEHSVFLEDLESGPPMRSPTKPQSTSVKVADGQGNDSSSSPKKSANARRWQDHDPYNLPAVDMQDNIAKAMSTSIPDPRLATEEELRSFIEDMRPEDFDVNSEAFKELPTEMQYEIVGDLRLKSRQTSHKRLQTMLKLASTPLDFSKAQIRNLQQRNTLTQQLLTTTDTIGKANVLIPVRVASERNREYVLVKNEGVGGGWVLGIRDEGTESKPIEVDARSDGGDSDDSMEAVVVPGATSSKVDPDLRQYRQSMALAAIGKRPSPKKASPNKTHRNPSKLIESPIRILRNPPEKDDSGMTAEEDADFELFQAIQDSLDQTEANQVQLAMEESLMVDEDPGFLSGQGDAQSDFQTEDIELENQNAGPGLPIPPRAVSSASSGQDAPPLLSRMAAATMLFGLPTALLEDDVISVSAPDPLIEDHGDDELEEVVSAQQSSPTTSNQQLSIDNSDDDMEEVVEVFNIEKGPLVPSSETAIPMPTPANQLSFGPSRSPTPALYSPIQSPATTEIHLPVDSTTHRGFAQDTANHGDVEMTLFPILSNNTIPDIMPESMDRFSLNTAARQLPSNPPAQTSLLQNISDDEVLTDWSRSPSPERPDEQPDVEHPRANQGLDAEGKAAKVMRDFDAADEINPHAEEGDFAQFMSRVQGRDLDSIRHEIDDELRTLNKEKKAAMRDSEDVTQQMIGQIKIMLKLFGIPYLSAPMEAEAQCAALVDLGLVDGIITDDSDTFLFGGKRVYRNMFNQSKTVECFLLNDLSRDLGLDREKLIRLAYLLGSDYVEGLPGVGPVVAMEILKEFDGDDGLVRFKEWWMKVQSGRDKQEDNISKFRRRFKKKFNDLYLSDDWPSPVVRDAYIHPSIDDSQDPFKWGLPDLDGLRGFLGEELGWSVSKVDDTILPIVRKVGQRGQVNALNRQAMLNGYFDISAGSGTFAPRQKQAYTSKRLQKVVSDFRKNRPKSTSLEQDSDEDHDTTSKADEPSKRKKAQPRNSKQSKGKAVAKKNKAPPPKKRKVAVEDKAEDSDEGGSQFVTTDEEEYVPTKVSAKPRPRPKPKAKPKPASSKVANEEEDSQDFFDRVGTAQA